MELPVEKIVSAYIKIRDTKEKALSGVQISREQPASTDGYLEGKAH
jgi:hypothetical protein